MAIEEGNAGPLFTLPDQNGEKRALKDLKGKTVVAWFYPKQHTSGCAKEASGFPELWREIEPTGAIVHGVSLDEMSSR